MAETKKKTTKKTTTKKTTKKISEPVVKVEVVKEKGFKTKLKDFSKKAKSFLNDPRPIIIVLLVLVLAFIIAFANYKNKYKVYVGSFKSDEIVINTVHVYLHPSINTFYSGGATYTGEAKKVYQYQIGYYYEAKDGFNYIKDASEELSNPIDLGDIISKTSYFNYSEFRNTSSLIFTREAKANMGKLHFIVQASTTKETNDGYDIKIDCPIDFTSF
jgi:hypothetical protein